MLNYSLIDLHVTIDAYMQWAWLRFENVRKKKSKVTIRQPWSSYCGSPTLRKHNQQTITALKVSRQNYGTISTKKNV